MDTSLTIDRNCLTGTESPGASAGPQDEHPSIHPSVASFSQETGGSKCLKQNVGFPRKEEHPTDHGEFTSSFLKCDFYSSVMLSCLFSIRRGLGLNEKPTNASCRVHLITPTLATVAALHHLRILSEINNDNNQTFSLPLTLTIAY